MSGAVQDKTCPLCVNCRGCSGQNMSTLCELQGLFRTEHVPPVGTAGAVQDRTCPLCVNCRGCSGQNMSPLCELQGLFRTEHVPSV
ncbi:hypothetical protein ACOMHN_019370 [Nucella lapillus]